MKTRDYRGFTFLELLIAITIFSIIAVAVYSSFNVGIRAWRKAENSYKTRQEARHALNSIGRELRNVVNFTPIAFEGSSNCVSFPRALKIPNPKGGYSEGIFKVTYSFDAQTQSLCYILQTYEESVKEKSGTKSLLTSGISEFKLKYAYIDGDKIIWKDSWEKEGLQIPLGVKISLSYPSENEGPATEFFETIFIPTGTLKEATEGL